MKRKSQKVQPEAEPAAIGSSFFRPASAPDSASGEPTAHEGWEAVEELLGEANAEYPPDYEDQGDPEAQPDELDAPEEPVGVDEPARPPRFEAAPPAEVSENPRSIRTAGIVTTMVGLGLGAAMILVEGPALELLTKLAGFGLGAGSLVIGGIAMTAIGALHAEVDRRSRDAAQRARSQERWLRELAESLRHGGGQGEQPEAVQAGFDRLDEKVANLTRATKLYGTPLLDISTQVGELVNRLQDLEQLGEKLAQAAGTDIDLEAVTSAIGKLEKRSEETADGLRRAIAAIEDSQSEILQTMRTTHEETRRAIAEGADHVSRNLEQHVALPAATAATDSMQLEELVKRVQGEVQTIVAAIHRLEARPATVAAPPAPTSGPNPSDQGAPSEQSATPTHSPTPPSPTLGEDAQEKIAGPRKASNKNVLGAIAKLRSMRG